MKAQQPVQAGGAREFYSNYSQQQQQQQMMPPGSQRTASYATAAPSNQVTITSTPRQGTRMTSQLPQMMQPASTVPAVQTYPPMAAPGFQQMPYGGSLTFAVTPAPMNAAPKVGMPLQA